MKKRKILNTYNLILYLITDDFLLSFTPFFRFTHLAAERPHELIGKVNKHFSYKERVKEAEEVNKQYFGKERGKDSEEANLKCSGKEGGKEPEE